MANPLSRVRKRGSTSIGGRLSQLEDAGDLEADNRDQLIGVPATVAPPPQLAELVEGVAAFSLSVGLGEVAQALADDVGNLQVGKLDHVGPDRRAGLDPRIGAATGRL